MSVKSSHWKGRFGIRNLRHYKKKTKRGFLSSFRVAEQIDYWGLTKHIGKISFVIFQVLFIIAGFYLYISMKTIVDPKIDELDSYAEVKKVEIRETVEEAYTINVAKIEEVRAQTYELMEMMRVAYPRIQLQVMKIQQAREAKRNKPIRAWNPRKKKWVTVDRGNQ